MEASKNAARGVKQAANAVIGLFRSSKFGARTPQRTDIRTQTVSRNAEIFYHNIEKVETLDRIRPALTYMDAVYYITSSPNGPKDIPSIMGRAQRLGGFKYEGSVQITPDVERALIEENTVSNKLAFLNKKGWVK